MLKGILFSLAALFLLSGPADGRIIRGTYNGTCRQGINIVDGCLFANQSANFQTNTSFLKQSGQSWVTPSGASSTHPWGFNSPGIDYPVGYYTALGSLKDPSIQANLPQDCTYYTNKTENGSIYYHPLVVCAPTLAHYPNGFTISGYNFGAGLGGAAVTGIAGGYTTTATGIAGCWGPAPAGSNPGCVGSTGSKILVITAVAANTLAQGQAILDGSGNYVGQLGAQTGGTTGGAGTWNFQTNQAGLNPTANTGFSGYSSALLNITTIGSGTLSVGQSIGTAGNAVFLLGAQVSGTAGGVGTYGFASYGPVSASWSGYQTVPMCVPLWIDSGTTANGVTVTNNNFVNGSSCSVDLENLLNIGSIASALSTSGLTVTSNNFDGQAANASTNCFGGTCLNNALALLIFDNHTLGARVVKYNLFRDVAGRPISTAHMASGTLFAYNFVLGLGYVGVDHGEIIQEGNNAGNTLSHQLLYNTVVTNSQQPCAYTPSSFFISSGNSSSPNVVWGNSAAIGNVIVANTGYPSGACSVSSALAVLAYNLYPNPFVMQWNYIDSTGANNCAAVVTGGGITYNLAGSYTQTLLSITGATGALAAGQTLTNGGGTGIGLLGAQIGATVATGSLTFGGNPSPLDTITLGGVTWTFVSSGATGNQTNIQGSLSATLTQLASDLTASGNATLALASYSAGASTLILTYATAGYAGNTFTLAASAATPSGATLVGGATTFTFTAAGSNPGFSGYHTAPVPPPTDWGSGASADYNLKTGHVISGWGGVYGSASTCS